MTKITSFLKKKPKFLLFGLLALGLLLIGVSYTVPKETKAPASTQNETEQRLSQVLSKIEGAGRVEVLVTDGEDGAVGALVVAEGGESLTVQSDLIRACCAVLKLPAENVQVFAKEAE